MSEIVFCTSLTINKALKGKKKRSRGDAHAQCEDPIHVGEDGCAHRPGAEEGNGVFVPLPGLNLSVACCLCVTLSPRDVSSCVMTSRLAAPQRTPELAVSMSC